MQTILAVDDEHSVRESYRAILSGDYKVLTAEDGQDGLNLLAAAHIDLVLLDLMMPGMGGNEFLTTLKQRGDKTPVVVVSGISSVEQAVDAMRNGAREFIIKPFDVDHLTRTVERVLSEDRKELELSSLREAGATSFDKLIGDSTAFREVIAQAKQAALADATVLITGESGTGKDMLARAIHSAGKRANEPFVHVSCCALPEHLVESELFGHTRGAFTGAAEKRTGKALVANNGTLFLDEIGEMPMATQGKLLQVLQESCFFPVGSDHPIEVDLRFICATNRDLAEAVSKNTFRQDLYYRVNVVHIEMPPLRQRREDIGPLARHFFEKHRPRIDTRLSAIDSKALNVLASYSWPGNVRELENVVQRLLVTKREEEILQAEHVSRILDGTPMPISGMNEFEGMALADAVAILERHLIERALMRSDQVQSRAAEMLGTTRRILKYKMDQYGIETESSEQDQQAS